MRIYLAGPMTGIKDQNFPMFDRVARWLRSEGHEVFNPPDLTRKRYTSLETFLSFSPEVQQIAIRKLFKTEMEWICLCAEAIYLLEGWENSKGATAEKCLGEALGLAIVPVDTLTDYKTKHWDSHHERS